jgi:hypothetical protein
MAGNWTGGAISGITLALLMSCAPPLPPPGVQVGTAFDGSYAGNTEFDKGDAECGPGGPMVLTVAKGYATMGAAVDQRAGWVSPDGSLTMTGFSRRHTAEVDGSFNAGTFTGVSTYVSSPHCVYNLLLKRQ